jgi:hypothetical protein
MGLRKGPTIWCRETRLSVIFRCLLSLDLLPPHNHKLRRCRYDGILSEARIRPLSRNFQEPHPKLRRYRALVRVSLDQRNVCASWRKESTWLEKSGLAQLLSNVGCVLYSGRQQRIWRFEFVQRCRRSHCLLQRRLSILYRRLNPASGRLGAPNICPSYSGIFLSANNSTRSEGRPSGCGGRRKRYGEMNSDNSDQFTGRRNVSRQNPRCLRPIQNAG